MNLSFTDDLNSCIRDLVFHRAQYSLNELRDLSPIYLEQLSRLNAVALLSEAGLELSRENPGLLLRRVDNPLRNR